MAVRARRRHLARNAIDQFQSREVQLVGLCPVFCPALAWLSTGALAVLLGAAANQLASHFAQPLQRKRWPGEGTQQALQARAVLCGDANAGVDREAAVCL